MMATEATAETIAKIPTTPDHELNTESASQDVSPEQPLVNGKNVQEDAKQDTEHVEANVISAEASVSGGSDTEASKTETSKAQGDEKTHARTASTVKKASFKPISVNKTFLTTKAATTTAPSKLGDKGTAGTATTPLASLSGTSARPRLVAKTGNGLRDSAPRTSASGNGGKPGAAPDASAVWNKNRPAPPPDPKRYTDEELKQQYGIHLATRLETDAPGKQANWADIDDDDDDWAPETIEWTDGTKITLPTADEVSSPVPAPATTAVVLEDGKATEAFKPMSPAPIASSASPKAKPSGFGSGRAGLVLKGATEKPTLVAKPPGPPTPVKSPWASLPPVDKALPLSVEISQQHAPQSRFSQRDPHGFHGMPLPAKEIAADDFSRSWREAPNSSRELYNSQSGRYEPVNDTRRGSMRNDARAHQPAVLQRPSQGDGPAEPSAAFQTHRAGGQDAGYDRRRRTSSNVSGGSGNFMRQMSRGHDMPPPHELLNVRRGSLAAVSDAPSSPRNYSPSSQPQGQRGYPNQQWQQRASPVISHPSPQSIHGQTIPPVASPSDTQIPNPNVVYEDPIEAQKKIMKQTREQAIKRRQDAEAKEEAERKERIRLKLEDLAKRFPSETKEAPKEEKPVPTQIQARETAGAQAKTSPSDDASEAKVDPPTTVSERLSPSTSTQPKPTEQIPSTENHTNGVREVQLPAAAPPPSQDGRAAQWQGNPAPSERYKPWAAPSTQQQPSRNVWGPPTNDRTLGNGTFNPELSRLPEMHQPARPGPIGPPNPNNGGSQYQARGQDQYASRPAPIGPPHRQQALSAEDQARRAAVANSGWGSLPEKLAKEDAITAQQRDQELAQRRDLQAQGIATEVRPVVIQETWRKVEINPDGSRGKLEQKVSATHDVGSNVRAPEEPTTRGIFEEAENARRPHLDGAGSQPPFNDAWRQSAMNVAPPVRGSRFFPANRDVRLEDLNVTFGRPSSPSPPPPTMAGHPVYDGDSAHPTVSLPRPAPVVKLPPATPLAPIAPPRPASFAAAVAAPAHSDRYNNGFASQTGSRGPPQSQDIRQQDSGNWSKKIKDLLNQSPPRTHVPAVAIDSSSKSALEHPNFPAAATVSLPSSSTGDLASDDGSIESKPAAEECFEEQEMGSLPIVKVPGKAPAAAWELAPTPTGLPRKYQVSQVTSAEQLHFPQTISNDRSTRTIQIKVPGQDEAKLVTVAASRQKSNPRSRGGRGGRGAHNRGGRGGRDSSSGFPSPNLDNASVSSSPNSSGRGGRGSRGGYGSNSNWNRHTPTPVHT